MERHDIIIIGAGIVGLATAYRLLEAQPRTTICILDKEARVAAHQSGRNSGVVHSGIYYRPGSLKASMAREGRHALVRFCAEYGIPLRMCGKLIVATRPEELDRLQELNDRAERNGVEIVPVPAAGIRDIEPYATGLAATHVLDTGVVDFPLVCETLARIVRERGGEIKLGCEVHSINGGIVEYDGGTVSGRTVINCGGLQSDKLAGSRTVRIVGFRGEFCELTPASEHLVRALIYPVPDPAFPFLGAHLTRGIEGHVHAGPNAVLALAREGYSWSVIDTRELRDLVRFPGFRKLARRYWREGAAELWRSASRHRLAADLRRLVPAIEVSDLVPAPSGVRAQALDVDGNLLDDFVIREVPGAIHVVNAPSPAATASLEIGRHISGLALSSIA